jgi:hypothetical protein
MEVVIAGDILDRCRGEGERWVRSALTGRCKKFGSNPQISQILVAINQSGSLKGCKTVAVVADHRNAIQQVSVP